MAPGTGTERAGTPLAVNLCAEESDGERSRSCLAAQEVKKAGNSAASRTRDEPRGSRRKTPRRSCKGCNGTDVSKMERQAACYLLKCFLEKRSTVNIDCKKELPGLLAYGIARGCFINPANENKTAKKLLKPQSDAETDTSSQRSGRTAAPGHQGASAGPRHRSGTGTLRNSKHRPGQRTHGETRGKETVGGARKDPRGDAQKEAAGRRGTSEIALLRETRGVSGQRQPTLTVWRVGT